MASGGCRKVAFYAGVGCLGLVILVAIGVSGMIFMARRAGNDGEQHPVPTSFTIPVPAPAPPPAPSPAGPQTPGVDLPALDANRQARAGVEPVRVILKLSEGDFTVQPGAPGSGVKVDGNFDPGTYALTQEESRDSEGRRQLSVEFRRRVPFFFIMFGNHKNQNKVAITLPEGVPTSLDLLLSRCESHVDLGGLTLTDLEAHMSMGDQDLNFSKPLVGKLARASFRFSMGDTKVRGLGNALPANLELHGSMGDVRVSFDGAWPPSSRISAVARMSMGDFRIVVPHNVRLKSRSTVSFGDSDVPHDEAQPQDDTAPVLELQTHASMGDLSVKHD
ncbi:MAG: hypothetical protein HY049_14195 [Acidobacteria bacterium]|nr:hypothetical protein [Acidobacteriota bacterium]